MPIIGLLRVRNESRYIERVIRSIQPICERIFVLDDKSTDDTADICERLGCSVKRSTSEGIDESRDKDELLSAAYDLLPDEHKLGNPKSPWYALLIDGDEELHGDDRDILRAIPESVDSADAYHLRIPYLWDSPDQHRVDGVYSRMANLGRPSFFRLMNDRFRFQRTPFGNGANFHCSSVPQELLHSAVPCAARLLHWGYFDRETRIRKYEFYNRIDPGNAGEDGYRHMVIGDLFPPDSRFMHAGPLRLERIQ